LGRLTANPRLLEGKLFLFPPAASPDYSLIWGSKK